MAKRLIDVNNEKIELKKRIKLENEVILDRIKDINEDLNINEREVQKFVLVLHTLMKVVSSNEGLDLLDGTAADLVLQVVLKISELFKSNIDSLKLPEFLKNVLKKRKSLFNKQTDQDAEHTGEAEKTSEAAGNESEEHDNIRIRLRRYKMKRFLAQPENVKLSKMVEQFEEWQLEEVQFILALEDVTTIENKHC